MWLIYLAKRQSDGYETKISQSELVLFKNTALEEWTTLQWKATQPTIYGKHKLALAGIKNEK